MNNRMEEFIDEKMREFKEELIRIIERENKLKTVRDIEKGDKYFYLDSIGNIESYPFENHPFDVSAREIGNMFLTREEAEFELERRKIEVIMKKYSRPFNENKNNWSIYYNFFYKTIEATFWSGNNYGVYHFETKEIAQQVIEEIGKERLKKYWFKVER